MGEPLDLDKRARDMERSAIERRKSEQRILLKALIAITAVFRAGAAGNVTCREAAIEILKIDKKTE